MHELSIVMGIIKIAEDHARAAEAAAIDEIELDIGTMSGIDMDSMEFAWTQAIQGTMLKDTVRKINSITAKAKCLDCDTEFEIKNYYDACPVCGEHLIEILQGKELKVRSLLVS
ncbi:hydrogenase maturation nickel metallochaperone HypA/HybF [Mucilaginibacter gotjawali]|uniref:Hydrogenase maturation factor HypA n=2 Tax=Mucilaginibacter gotjawali TaxID=1550579 RepID=A0A0X8X1N3_9SPHI|nr:hydrogenase maturation nickel metallochaperone HypA [Mucilaginibacter gotjawali]MBB3056152.1 hydrogenase nickel incorporation protein HypA/HybF [Mucilaginibacter gotjawali]BAU53508.1 Hydrogenase/urease nickel incorporation protein HypA [Mucilaginibacter gotjawali]